MKDFEDDIGSDAVNALYVDPLPHEAILNFVLSSNTTFLLGRKGTGKSTVFARAQNVLRTKKNLISIYVDVKSLYDIVNTSDVATGNNVSNEVDPGILRAHLLRKAFLGSSLAEILNEIDNASGEMSLWDKFTGRKKSLTELRTNIDSLRNRVKTAGFEDQELPILKHITKNWKSRIQRESSDTVKAEAKVGAKGSLTDTTFEASANASVSDFDKSLDDHELYNEYSDVVLRSFPFESIITEIRELLEECGLLRLVVFFDDFSELNFVDQRLFVDIIHAPLNNSSNEAIKLKVAGYPGRVYFGRIDPSKIDTLSLDFSALYESAEVQTMEQAATDYAIRLLAARFEKFSENINEYFDDSVPLDQHLRLLFQCTFNVPRLMGALLHTCYLDNVSKGQAITQTSIKLAARKYYENTIVKYFDRLNKYALEPFENKLDRHNQRELINAIVNETRRVRNGIRNKTIGGTYFDEVRNPPVSHFIVSPSLSSVFQSLEANFLVFRYKETRDKNGQQVVVYALFYGLTEAERITWGYPPGREFRNYFVQRCFDYSGAIHEFLALKKTIRCSHCGACFSLDQKGSFELYKWKCPECHEGRCEVVDLAGDFENEVKNLEQEAILEPVELDILNALNEEDEEMRAGEISALIDVTYQLVGRRTSKLGDMGLADKNRSPADNKVRSRITDRARANYFKD